MCQPCLKLPAALVADVAPLAVGVELEVAFGRGLTPSQPSSSENMFVSIFSRPIQRHVWEGAKKTKRRGGGGGLGCCPGKK